jgi:hypothetical protein
MPIYEFIAGMQKHFELLAIKRGDLVEIKCPTCDSDNLERVLSKVTVTLRVFRQKTKSRENRSCSSGTCSMITLPGTRNKLNQVAFICIFCCLSLYPSTSIPHRRLDLLLNAKLLNNLHATSAIERRKFTWRTRDYIFQKGLF